MKQTIDNAQKCEVVLKLEDNIVCQRFFSVRNFNNRACNSLDLHWTVSSIIDNIVNMLKLKTLFIMESHHKATPMEEAPSEENFTLTIKKGNKVIYDTITPANIYPPKVRYTVDIRPQISSIIRELTKTLSDKKVVTHYQDYDLITNH
tara:strand:- start:358 stop:801 length:444 start_codon:yes stop_codon:yes gene_type:complete